MNTVVTSAPNKAEQDDIPLTLVIDDNNEIRQLIETVLKKQCRVIGAPSVETGLAIIERRRPALVITDYEMPGTDGLEGIRQMRKMKPHMGIIMLTGSASSDLMSAAMRSGADICIPKPFRLDVLRNSVRNCLVMSSAQ